MPADLGLEAQRQWSDAATVREAPCLLGLYSVVALMGLSLGAESSLPIRTAAWYRKAEATFADVLAAVRRQCWEGGDIRVPDGASGFVNIARPVLDRQINAACYVE